MKYTTYIFDFDFTLADATNGIVDSVNYALNRLGLDSKDRDSIRKTVGMTLTEIFFVLTGISDEHLAKQFVSLFRGMADKVMADNTVLFDDTIETLSQLKSNHFNTAIVTSKLHYRIDEVLKNNAITGLIDYIVGFEDVDIAKPSPEGLLKTVEHFNVEKRFVLYIGDSLIDANTAVNASVDFAAVVTGTTTAQEFMSLPHIYTAENLKDLMKHINIGV